jgi:hypothetical protein
MPKGHLARCQTLKQSWQETSKKKVQDIQSLSQVNLESYWHFLVKPHSQWLVLRCLSNATIQFLPALSDAVFTGQMCMQLITSPPAEATHGHIQSQRADEESIWSTVMSSCCNRSLI